jgi:hypothetical protein
MVDWLATRWGADGDQEAMVWVKKLTFYGDMAMS